jgi:TAG lipase/steryl ester hydrolase/phospholipase A2/LPA acyltransferase
VDNDLPMTRLAEMFNVNHFIVSQVNPHVVPFLDKEEGILAQDVQEDSSSMTNFKWLNDIASVARGEALHRLQVLAEMGVFPNYVTKLRSVLNQRYSGDITIFPSISYSHFPRVLRNPTPDYMQECLLTGERATWSKLSRIRNHLAIELALDDAIHQIRARAVFSPLGVPFRQPRLGRPASQGDDGSQQVRKETKRVERDASGPSYFSNSPALTYFSPVARPYLPKRPPKMPMALVDRERRSQPAVQVVSPSGNAGGSSSDDEMSENSDTSYSPKHASPSRWASNRRLFPHASLPSTPSHRASYLRHGTRGYLDFTQSERYQETRNVPPVAISDPDAPSDSQEHVRPSPVLHSATLAPPHRAIDKSVKFTTDTKAPLKERRSPSGPDTDDDVKLEMDLSDFASS